MRIIGISGSPRGENSRTMKLVNAVLGGARHRGAETELVDIGALDIEHCIGCQVCYAEGECIQQDDLYNLWAKMLRADGIVLGSPVYISGVTAQLKTVIDRLADAIHCQMLAGKYGCAVTTAGSSGISEVLRYLRYFLNELGVVTVGEVGVALGRNPEALDAAIIEATTLGQALADAIQSRRQYADQEREIVERGVFFRQLVNANKEAWRHQYDYWMEKGWM